LTTEAVLHGIANPSLRAWQNRFKKRAWPWPPTALTLIGLKAERRLEVWHAVKKTWRHLGTYPVLGASGQRGPKLREGDRQVPEGLYRVTALNPNSRFHLSLRLNYPNGRDLKFAEDEGRTAPGTDIYIHGGNESVGCLAVGDQAAEDLFALVAAVGVDRVSVILAPRDFRERLPDPEDAAGHPYWVRPLYREIAAALQDFHLRETATPSAPPS
jgi:hypothetical protein